MNYDTTSPAAAEPNSSTETFSTSLGDDSFVSIVVLHCQLMTVLPQNLKLPAVMMTSTLPSTLAVILDLTTLALNERHWHNLYYWSHTAYC